MPCRAARVSPGAARLSCGVSFRSTAMHRLRLSVLTVGLSAALLACHAPPPRVLKSVKLGDTKLCYPAQYSPDTSFTDAFLEPVADQLDSSEGSELISIPASEVGARVPGYALQYLRGNGLTLDYGRFGVAYAR